MSSSVSPALAKLDDSLAIIQPQLECLGAALEVDEEQLRHNLTEACYRAAMLDELIRGECPGAEWSDRQGLDRLVQELEIAAEAKRNEERRQKLREVADELEAGRVKHRIEARTTALNALRVEAVQSLRTEALAEQVRDLPGPQAEVWLHWVCNLRDDADALVLAVLRRDFPALERFAAALDERYWIAGQKSGEFPPKPSDAALATEALEIGPAAESALSPATSDGSKPDAPVILGPNNLPENMQAQFEKAMQSGNYAEALALCYNGRSSDAPPVAEPLADDAEEETFWHGSLGREPSTVAAPAAAPAVSQCESCGSTYRGEFHLCPVDHSTRRATAQAILGTSKPDASPTSPVATAPPAETPDAGASPESAEKELERLKGIPEQQSGTPEVLPIFEEPVPPNRQLFAWIVAASFIVLCVIVAVGYHFSKAGAQPVIAAASTAESPKDADAIRDSEIQKQVEQRLADLKESSIQVSVEDGVVTLQGHLPSQAEVVKAETLVAQTSGVKAVESKLQVEARHPARAGPGQR
jgi:HAMP domain-containing protein